MVTIYQQAISLVSLEVKYIIITKEDMLRV